VVLSSHVPTDVEAGASQVLILQRGTVRAQGTIDAVRALAAGQVHEVTVPATEVDHVLRTCQVSQMTLRGPHALLRVVGPLPAGRTGDPVEATLEDAYLWVQGAHALPNPTAPAPRQ